MESLDTQMNAPSRYGDARIFALLDALGIPYEYHAHAPAPTIEAALQVWRGIDCQHCKNIFLRNHKGNRHFYLIVDGHSQANIHMLEGILRQGKLSFASEPRMRKYLNVQPGAVSPLGLVYDQEHHVHVFIDEVVLRAERVGFHPNDNRATLVIPTEGLIRYLDHLGNSYESIALGM